MFWSSKDVFTHQRRLFLPHELFCNVAATFVPFWAFCARNFQIMTKLAVNLLEVQNPWFSLQMHQISQKGFSCNFTLSFRTILNFYRTNDFESSKKSFCKAYLKYKNVICCPKSLVLSHSQPKGHFYLLTKPSGCWRKRSPKDYL